MRSVYLSIFIFFVAAFNAFSQFSASGGSGIPYAYTTDLGGTGLDAVYLFNTLSGASLTYTSSNTVTFYKFDNGIGSKVVVPASDIINNAGSYQIINIEDGWGYYADDTGRSVCVVDYSKYIPAINSITPETPEDESERCGGNLNLKIDKTEPLLQFKATNGSTHNINRTYSVSYPDLQWNSTSWQFEKYTKEYNNINIATSVSIKPPLGDTNFTVSGDQFAAHFGIPTSFTSGEYKAVAVEAYMQTKYIADGLETDSINDSAPIQMRFYGYANEPTTNFYEWLIYQNGDNNIVRYTNETDIEYTFTQAGKYQVVLKVSSSGENGECLYEVKSEEFEISESSLKIPNFFSPDGSPGINDVFKVKYKSLVKFKATIFNRWENKIYEWSDPEEGWDGKYNGKYVTPGVYFYVIEATGSEGKKYKKGGSITILRSK